MRTAESLIVGAADGIEERRNNKRRQRFYWGKPFRITSVHVQGSMRKKGYEKGKRR